MRILSTQPRNAFVTARGLPGDILIKGERERNRAFNGDKVVVRLDPVSQWLPKAAARAEQEEVKLAKATPAHARRRPRPKTSPAGQDDGAGGASVRVNLAALLEGENEDAAAAAGNGEDVDKEEEEEDAMLTQYQALQERENKAGAGDDAEKKGDANDSSDAALRIATELWAPRNVSTESWQVRATTMPNAHGTHESLTDDGIVALDGRLQPTGKVVFVKEPGHMTEIVGGLVLPPNARDIGDEDPLPENVSFVTFHPADRRVPHIVIPRLDLPAAFVAAPKPWSATKIAMVSLLPEWPADSNLPLGQNVRSLGEMGQIVAETEALLNMNEIAQRETFPAEVLESLQEYLPATDPEAEAAATAEDDSTVVGDVAQSLARQSNWQIPDEVIAERRDLRDTRIFTIDPTTAKDLDDAVHVRHIEDDVYEVGVHIADVSYFVSEDTPLDTEAAKRATSVYLVQKVIPMLPPILCEELCSLNPNVDRLAFSATWKMHADGTRVNEPPWMGRTVIRSCAKLDYATAQHMIDGTITEEDADNDTVDPALWEPARRPSRDLQWGAAVVRDVKALNKIARGRREKRLSHGALVLNRTQLIFDLDADGNPSNARGYPHKQSNELIEEYMLLANFLVAEQLIIGTGPEAFLRRHPVPDMTGLEELKALGTAIGVDVNVTSAKGLQDSLNHITHYSDKVTVQAITQLFSHSMKPAEYFPAGAFPPKQWQHYALSIPYYTHFTSPIRRYADVMVHRLLDRHLNQQQAARAEGDGEDDARAAGMGGGHGGGTAQAAAAAMRRTAAASHTAVDQHEQTGAMEEMEARVQRLSSIADHCNEMRMAAKHAQERSAIVFLAVWLASAGAQMHEAVVIGVGSKSFTVMVQAWGLEFRLFLDEYPSVGYKFDDETNELHLGTGVEAARLRAEAMAEKEKKNGDDGEGASNGNGNGGGDSKTPDSNRGSSRGGGGRHGRRDRDGDGAGGNTRGRGGSSGGRGRNEQRGKNSRHVPHDQHVNFDLLTVRIMGRVMLRCEARMEPPIDVDIFLVGEQAAESSSAAVGDEETADELAATGETEA